jgi:RNase H-fold protein (predicted Holliday junction resolvase)
MYNNHMKYMGIDYGTKRIGIAVSDDGDTIAFPYKILENSKTLSKNYPGSLPKNKYRKLW